MQKLLAVLGLALALVASPALAQTGAEVDDAVTTDLGDPAPYHVAFDAIHDAVAKDDAAGVAEWVSYPITVNVGGKALTIDDAAQFEAEYAAIITGDIKDAILAQTWETLFVNADGIMYGNGQVWLNGICKDEACAQFDVKIITIQSTSDITPKAN